MVAPPDSDLPQLKRAAREAALARRAGSDPALGAQLTRHVLATLAPAAGCAVSAFWPMGEEIDIRPLLWALHARGHKVLLPETPKLGNPLIFRHWHPGMAMVPERFGTARPTGPVGRPDWLFVPLLAFDRAGRRLGYGGGYFDRTLAGLPGACAVGCAYAVQEMDEVPAGDRDVRLDAVATELGVIRCERA